MVTKMMTMIVTKHDVVWQAAREGSIGKGMPAPMLLRRFAPFWVAIPPCPPCNSSSMNIIVMLILKRVETATTKIAITMTYTNQLPNAMVSFHC